VEFFFLFVVLCVAKVAAPIVYLPACARW